jgi:CobQ-like glutamine amidotransferase family enzyme
MAEPRRLRIAWLYGNLMNIYGDRGNVLVLAQRARWRNIEPEILEIGIGEPIPDDIDIFFFGGGQDEAQIAVSRDLAGAKGESIRASVEQGAALLSVCGGYQLLGHDYRPHDAEPLAGIGLFDIHSTAGPERFIGNVVVDTDWGPLVGFENHSGLTYLGDRMKPLGKVRIGRGNNGKDGTEGVVYKRAIGCYLHGALLPKNPAIADWLIEGGLLRRYGDASLAPLADRLEELAHKSAIARAETARV